jgi:undecaprenyl diphosphate synthase
MLWQVAESELVFTDELWPDFSRESFEAAIEQFRRQTDPREWEALSGH